MRQKSPKQTLSNVNQPETGVAEVTDLTTKLLNHPNTPKTLKEAIFDELVKMSNDVTMDTPYITLILQAQPTEKE